MSDPMKTNSDHIPSADPATEELIAYLDGELDPQQADKVETKLERDPKLRQKADSYRKTWDLLDFLPRPEPDKNFTEQTISRIEAIQQLPEEDPAEGIVAATPSKIAASISRSHVTASSISSSSHVTATIVTTPATSAPRWQAILFLVLGGIIGLFTAEAAIRLLHQQQQKQLDAEILAEVDLLKRWPLLEFVDDWDFLQALDGPELFGDEQLLSRFLEPIDLQGNRSEMDFLRLQMQRFKLQSSNRQEQSREIERRLKSSDEATRTTLNRVLQAYTVWIAELPSDDRKRIGEAANRLDRLVTVKDIREKQWLAQLPLSQQQLLKKTTDLSEQADLIKQWRDEELQREQEWRLAGPLMDQIGEKIRALLDNPTAKKQVEAWLQTLDKLGIEGGGRELNFLKQELRNTNNVNWTWFGYRLYRLQEANQQRMFPGPLDGPKSWETLPGDFRKALLDRDKQAQKTLKQMTQKSQNRWPDFAVQATILADQLKVPVPDSFGPNRLEALPSEVKNLLKEQLFPALEKSPQGKRWLEEIKRAEKGHWPELPRTIVRIAQEAKIVLTGWMLPSGNDEWQNIFDALKKRRRNFIPPNS